MHEDCRQYMCHFPGKFSKGMEEYANDVVFALSRYLFVWREGKHKLGYCTHCNTVSGVSTDYNHNTTGYCPSCRSMCTVKAAGRGHSKLIDYAYFVYYEKSVIDPNVIVAYGIDACRDYREDYMSVKTEYNLTAMYVFEMDNSVMMQERSLWCGSKGWEWKYVLQGSVFSLFSQRQNAGGHWYSWKKSRKICCSKNSIETAVTGTPFQYSCWKEYFSSESESDMVRFFSLYSQYPCIEYLTKLNMKDLVLAKLTGNLTHGAVHWRGKTLPKVLRLSKSIINEIRKEKVDVDPVILRMLQMIYKEGRNIPIKEVEAAAKVGDYYFQEISSIVKNTKATFYTAIQYLLKQYRTKNDKHYPAVNQVVVTWRDYIADCRKLELDLSQDCILYPGHLHRAHQNTIKQISFKENQLLNAKIATRLKNLIKKYSFENAELLIRPAESSAELVIEGKELNHCVGGYAQRYADGETNILVIREKSEPDKPYFTMEIRKDSIVQVGGLKNCAPDKQVKAFVEAFTEEKLQKKKVRIAISA